MSFPLVSILVPIYNQQSAYLRQCIDSVLKQDYPNLEIIISDNHSTNEVPTILSTYKDARIRLVKPPEHLPLTPHFQWASEQVRGEYIQFVCSDDWIEEGCVEALVGLMQPHPNVSMAFCNAKLSQGEKVTDFVYLKPGIYPSHQEFQEYMQMRKVKGNFVGGMFRTSIYKKVGGKGYGGLVFGADKWLMIQMAAHGDVAYTDKSLAVFRIDNPMRGERIITYVEDNIKQFSLIEQRYLDKVEGGVAAIKKARRYVAFELLYAIPRNWI